MNSKNEAHVKRQTALSLIRIAGSEKGYDKEYLFCKVCDKQYVNRGKALSRMVGHILVKHQNSEMQKKETEESLEMGNSSARKMDHRKEALKKSAKIKSYRNLEDVNPFAMLNVTLVNGAVFHLAILTNNNYVSYAYVSKTQDYIGNPLPHKMFHMMSCGGMTGNVTEGSELFVYDGLANSFVKSGGYQFECFV